MPRDPKSASGQPPTRLATSLPKAEMVRICEELITFRLQGNLKKVMTYFAPDAKFRLAGSSAANPLSTVCVGHQQILEKIRNMNVLLEYCDIKPIAYVTDGDHFVVRWTGRWRNRGTGPAELLEGAVHVLFRDGLIVDYTNFVDTAVIATLLDWPS